MGQSGRFLSRIDHNGIFDQFYTNMGVVWRGGWPDIRHRQFIQMMRRFNKTIFHNHTPSLHLITLKQTKISSQMTGLERLPPPVRSWIVLCRVG